MTDADLWKLSDLLNDLYRVQGLTEEERDEVGSVRFLATQMLDGQRGDG